MYFIIFERNLYVKKKKTSKNESIKRETLISLINLITLLTIEKNPNNILVIRFTSQSINNATQLHFKVERHALHTKNR